MKILWIKLWILSVSHFCANVSSKFTLFLPARNNLHVNFFQIVCGAEISRAPRRNFNWVLITSNCPFFFKRVKFVLSACKMEQSSIYTWALKRAENENIYKRRKYIEKKKRRRAKFLERPFSWCVCVPQLGSRATRAPYTSETNYGRKKDWRAADKRRMEK